MSFDIDVFNAYIDSHQERFIEEFRQFVAIPSVAAQKRGIIECADWVEERLAQLGANVQRFATNNNGSPIILAEIGSGERTLMVYNHYDVQPEAPLDLWESSPFELSIRDGVMYGRGVADNKGELLPRLQAVETWLQTHGDLPIKLKFVFEGEEEISSVNLPAWVHDHRDLLGADGVLWEGGGYDESGRYTMAEGCKGIAYFELHCQGASHDLHSSIAPMVVNPAWRLVWALNTMKDENDRITIDGYMDHVKTMPSSVIERIDALPFESERIKNRIGIDSWLNGMDDVAAHRRLMLEPTITICGLESGYTDEGSKTVLPAKAMAKIDCRLVPDLTPEIAQNLIRKHLDARGFSDIEVILLGGEGPAMQLRDSALRQAAIAASQHVFQQEPIMIPWFAGSGPMYPLSVELDIPAVSAGATWHPNTRAHSPNENIYVKDYFETMRFMAALIEQFAIA